MEQVTEWWASLLKSRPDWQLILQFLQVLTWPAVVVFGLVTVRPGRIIDYLLENGGELAAGGASIKLSKKIDEVAASIRSDDTPEETAELPPSNPLGDDADRYTTMMNGWGLVTMALEDAVSRANLEPFNGLRPMDAVKNLRQTNWIGSKIEKNIQALWDLRNRVKNAGSNRLNKIGITREAADEYYISAAKMKKSIGNAISYRERVAAETHIQMTPVTAAPAGQQTPIIN